MINSLIILENMLNEAAFNCSYHDNAFVASRALHVVNGLNASATFPLLEWFFKYQVSDLVYVCVLGQ